MGRAVNKTVEQINIDLACDYLLGKSVIIKEQRYARKFSLYFSSKSKAEKRAKEDDDIVVVGGVNERPAVDELLASPKCRNSKAFKNAFEYSDEHIKYLRFKQS